MRVAADDPLAADVRALLDEHLADMRCTSPPESVHALDPAALAAPGLTFLTARDEDGVLLGCGALKAIGDGRGEIKSMRTAPTARGGGVATSVLAALLRTAQEDGLSRVLLETGTQASFDPAVRLSERHGFARCGPFAGYRHDPNSRYLALDLSAAGAPAGSSSP